MTKISHTDDSKNTVFSNRHPSYIDTNGLAWYLFKSDQKTNVVPSYRSCESVSKTFIEYLNKNGMILADAFPVGSSDKSIHRRELFDPFDRTEHESAILYQLDKYENIKLTSPIIFKLQHSNNIWSMHCSSLIGWGWI